MEPSVLPPLSLCTSVATSHILPSIYTLLSFTGLLGNILSLWILIGRIPAAASTPVHLCLSHLNVSNVLLSLITPLLAAYYALGPVWPLGSSLCQVVLHFVTPVFFVNMNVSIFILAWVALSRFAVLVQHRHSSGSGWCAWLFPQRFFTSLTRRRTATWVCTGVWVLAVGVTLPFSMIHSITEAVVENGEDGEEQEMCYSSKVEIAHALSATMMWPFLIIFYLLYLMVLVFYAVVLKHIRQSRRSSTRTATQALLGRVYRNIVVIQVVLSVCLLPYHIFRPIFNDIARGQLQLPIQNNCHPLSTIVELKSCLLCLAALRGSTDPLMYFLLDKTFRHHTRRLLCGSGRQLRPQMCKSVTGRVSQPMGKLVDGVVSTASMNICH